MRRKPLVCTSSAAESTKAYRPCSSRLTAQSQWAAILGRPRLTAASPCWTAFAQRGYRVGCAHRQGLSLRSRVARLRVRSTVLKATLKWRGKCGLTIHSSRRRFAARLNSGVGRRGDWVRSIETEIATRGTPERVWAVLTDFRKYPEWNPFIRDASGELAIGARLKVRVHPPD